MHDMAMGFLTLPNLVFANIFDEILGNISPLLRIAVIVVMAAFVLAFIAASYIPSLAQKVRPAYFLYGLFGLLIASIVINAFTTAFAF